MSQDIICTECNTPNAPGSKFCNNCGSKLPLGTHIICSSCGASNTIDRIFCDDCGTRLVAESAPPEEEPEETPPATGGKAFSLPARKPGDTGDLDPRNVPDWLKTGETKQEQPGMEGLDEDEDLPRVEELSQKKQTGDLPDWLVSEADSDPIIHAPTIISTEFYQDLLDRAEGDLPQPEDLFPEEDSGANLPDWLQDTGSLDSSADKGLTEFLSETTDADAAAEADDDFSGWLDEPDEVEPPPEQPQKEAGLTEWLSQDSGFEETADESEDDDLDDSLTGWLADIRAQPGQQSSPADKEGLTDWLSEDEEEDPFAGQEEPADFDDSLTSWLSDPEAESDTAVPAQADQEGLTDWLSEDEEEDPFAIQEDQADFDDSLTGWLADVPLESEEDFLDDDFEEPAADSAFSDRLTDWLSEDAALDVETAAPEQEPAADEEEIKAITGKLTGWLTELPDDPDEAESEAPAAAEADFSDWFVDEEAEAAQAESPATVPADVSNRLTDWLSDLDDLDTAQVTDEETDEPEPDLPVAPEQGSARVTDWLSELPEEEESVSTDPDFADDEEETSFDEAARLSAWLSGSDQDKAGKTKAEERFDWLDEPETPEAASLEEDIPSDFGWLDETEEELTNIFQSQPSIKEEMPDWLAGVADDDEQIASPAVEDPTGELEELFGTERKAAETELDWLQETGSLQLDDDLAKELGLDDAMMSDSSFDVEELINSDEPDWLADLTAMEAEESDQEQAAETTAVPEPAEMAEAFEDLAPEAEEADLDESQAPAEDWESEADFAAEENILPDWISQLDSTVDLDAIDNEEFDLVSDEALPDWVAGLRPGREMNDSVLPGALQEQVPDTLSGIPEELVGSDLPDWLQDIPKAPAEDVPSIPMPADTQMSDIPGWLQEGLDLQGDDSDLFDEEDGVPVSDEWSAILSDLPSPASLQETLPRAEIPEWVMDLKPAELSGGKAAPAKTEPEGPEETVGPLSGLRGVIAIEPVIALPREAAPVQQFTVSPEQQHQVNMLQHLTQNGQEQEAALAKKESRTVSGWIRPLFALILIVAVAVGYTGEITFDRPTVIPLPVQGVYDEIEIATGQNVLVAFEYTPAMAGELTPEAETLLANLNDNGSQILTLSQYTAGTAIADQVTENLGITDTALGYLPGGAIGLRRLGECLSVDENCDTMFTAPLDRTSQNQLQAVSLIIILTANRENLVNWIEQVEAPAVESENERPLIAGVTQSLSPVASPYFATGQLKGVLNGIPGTAAYQAEFYEADNNEAVNKLYDAQITAQMLLIVVLLLGALIYLISGLVEKRRQKQT